MNKSIESKKDNINNLNRVPGHLQGQPEDTINLQSSLKTLTKIMST